ncbi:hypothetical protein [Rhodopirellula islandica]|uniref:hypothetical protein n=1 Tax=Rhodopirellula islandica TaxID=595434 RepID=UPI0012373FF7|nr:hypothetical protein [Rhodopirellula islandica]
MYDAEIDGTCDDSAWKSSTTDNNIAEFLDAIERLEIRWSTQIPSDEHARNVDRKLKRVDVAKIKSELPPTAGMSYGEFVGLAKALLERHCLTKSLPQDCTLCLVMKDRWHGW